MCLCKQHIELYNNSSITIAIKVIFVIIQYIKQKGCQVRKILIAVIFLAGMSANLLADQLENYKLGNAYLFGSDKIEINVTKAVEYFTKACDNGHTNSCYSLGDIYRNGKNEIKKDINKAKKYLKSACERGDKDACVGLAYAYRDSQDAVNAIKAFSHACKVSKNPIVCSQVEAIVSSK